MAPLTDIQIANLALSRIGQLEGVTGITGDETAAGVAVQAVYETVRKQLLGSYTWSFATVTNLLTESVVAPTKKWAYAYTLAADFLRAEAIWTGVRNPRSEQRIPFEVDSSIPLLYTDEAPVTTVGSEWPYLTYVYAAPATEYSWEFSNALAWALAAELALSVAKKVDMGLRFGQVAEATRLQAIAMDRYQSQADVPALTPSIAARR